MKGKKKVLTQFRQSFSARAKAFAIFWTSTLIVTCYIRYVSTGYHGQPLKGRAVYSSMYHFLSALLLALRGHCAISVKDSQGGYFENRTNRRWIVPRKNI
jgi:hypothetical protein